MQTKQKILNTMMLLACSSISTQTLATLPTNAILEFDAGVVTTSSYSGTVFVKSGSYFGMDINGNGAISPGGERTALTQNAGLSIGKSQFATGSHPGSADGSESPGIDLPWFFFSNTGLHWTQSPASIISDDGAGNVAIDLSGWVVAWNGVQTIPMSGGAWEGGFTSGQAKIVCATDCSDGDTYTLDYSATVPANCGGCGFEGVPYRLHFVGTINVPEGPSTSSGTYGPGTIATAVGSIDGRISMDDLLNNGGTADPDFSFGNGLYNFTVLGAGASTEIMIPLTAPIPADAIYRKFINGAWSTFTNDANNLVASALATAGTCPPAGNAAYNHNNGLIENDDCLQLTIADGDIYDDDANVNDIADPGGIATPVGVYVDSRTSGTDGCSMSGKTLDSSQRADWWFVAGFLGLLGLFRLKRNKS